MDATSIEKTFACMGLQSKRSIAKHLLQENTYDSNLVPDIHAVDYTKNHRGRTNLAALADLPMFVDDIYIYGYLRRNDIVYKKGSVSCTLGESGAAKAIVGRISIAARDTFGKNLHTRIVHTVSYTNSADSTIRDTVRQIEN